MHKKVDLRPPECLFFAPNVYTIGNGGDQASAIVVSTENHYEEKIGKFSDFLTQFKNEAEAISTKWLFYRPPATATRPRAPKKQ
jgi:hypothetical protein